MDAHRDALEAGHGGGGGDGVAWSVENGTVCSGRGPGFRGRGFLPESRQPEGEWGDNRKVAAA